MVEYYLYAILLENCTYSNNAHELLVNNKIKHTIKMVNSKNKNKFKMDNYNTYPQIFLKKEGSFESLFFGGYTDLNDIIIDFYNNNIDINKFKNKYNWWSRKAIFRLIQLINN